MIFVKMACITSAAYSRLNLLALGIELIQVYMYIWYYHRSQMLTYTYSFGEIFLYTCSMDKALKLIYM